MFYINSFYKTNCVLRESRGRTAQNENRRQKIAAHIAELTIPSTSCDSCQMSIALSFGVQHSTWVRALERHSKLGHPNSARYNQLAELFLSVPLFPQSTLNNILCILCSLAKAKRSTIHPSSRSVSFPLERIHLDVL